MNEKRTSLRLRIVALGHQHGPHLLDNDFFESLSLNTTSQWIEERTGIKTRYSVLAPELVRALNEQKTSLPQLVAEKKVPALGDQVSQAWNAALKSLASQTFHPQVVICGTSIPDFDIPAHGSIVAQALGIEDVLCFDVNSACSSFVTNLMVMRGLFATTDLATGLIANVERYSSRMDFTDRSSCVLFGDGSTICLVEKDSTKPGLEFLDGVMHSDPSSWQQVQIPIYESFRQNGAAVQKFAISKTVEVSRELLARHNLRSDQVRYFVGHQANLRMLQSSAEKLGFQGDQHLFNVDCYGNQGAAGAPSVLAQNWGRFQDGDLVLVAVVGSGLTWGAALMRFCAKRK